MKKLSSSSLRHTGTPGSSMFSSAARRKRLFAKRRVPCSSFVRTNAISLTSECERIAYRTNTARATLFVGISTITLCILSQNHYQGILCVPDTQRFYEGISARSGFIHICRTFSRCIGSDVSWQYEVRAARVDIQTVHAGIEARFHPLLKLTLHHTRRADANRIRGRYRLRRGVDAAVPRRISRECTFIPVEN